MHKQQWIRVVGYLLGAISFYLIYLQLVDSDISWGMLGEQLAGPDYGLLLLALILYVMVMLIGAWVWGSVINQLSDRPLSDNHQALISVYAKSNVGKYLPGNFMQFVGRNILGNQLGYRHGALLLATAFEMVFSIMVGAGIMLLVVLTGWSQINFSEVQIMSVGHQPLLLILLATGLLLLWLFKKQLLNLLQQVSQMLQSRLLMARMFLGYATAYVFLGVCNWVIFWALNGTASWVDFHNFWVIYLLSWIAGFIIPGPPGGLGVRELIYISLLSTHYDVALVTLTALTLRLINIIGDVVFFWLTGSLMAPKNLTMKHNKQA